MSFKEQLLLSFQNTQPLNLDDQLAKYACVAIILRGTSSENLEIGYIQRAVHPEDRWSGQLAFPGGKREEQDPTDLATVLRETFEEIGIALQEQELLGRLSDIQARKAGSLLDFFIRPFVFYVDRGLELSLDTQEVADFFWVPQEMLRDFKRQIRYKKKMNLFHVDLPAIHLDRDPVLWGLTYMMTQDLLKILPK